MIHTSITRNCVVFLLTRRQTRSAIYGSQIFAFYNNGYKTLFIDQLVRSKATCSFNAKQKRGTSLYENLVVVDAADVRIIPFHLGHIKNIMFSVLVNFLFKRPPHFFLCSFLFFHKTRFYFNDLIQTNIFKPCRLSVKCVVRPFWGKRSCSFLFSKR